MRSARTGPDFLMVVKTDCIMRSAGLVAIYWIALSYTEMRYSGKKGGGNLPEAPALAIAQRRSWTASGRLASPW